MPNNVEPKYDAEELRKPEEAYEGEWRPGGKGAPPLRSRPQELMTEEEQGLVLSDLYHPSDKWSVEDKVRAATAMMIRGNSKRASADTGIPDSTIRWWATKSSWWPSLMKQVRKDKQEELDALQTDILHKTIGQLAERVEKGEEVVTKDGDIVHRGIGARDLAIIHGTIYDKRALLRGDPTSKTERSDSDAIEELGRRFEKFAEQMKISGNMAKPIEGEKIGE